MTEIFVFGSNEGGYHGAGAAKTAYRHHGAEMGIGFGPTGESFAIPTKDRTIRNTLSLGRIWYYVSNFLVYAIEHPELQFKITRIGCGLAGLQDADMAPMFKEAPSNCFFDTEWKPWLGDNHNYWGTF